MARTRVVVLSLGNSRASWASLTPSGRLGPIRRAPTPEFDAAVLPAQSRVHLASTVVGPARRAVRALKARGSTVVWWGRDRAIPVRHRYRKPHVPGADRLLAALAAHRRARGPCVVIDAGTAVTINLIDADGVFLGGAIGPGLAAMATGLAARAPEIPRARVGAKIRFPARSPQEAVDAGVQMAYLGAALLFALQIAPDIAPIYVTGGDARVVAKAVRAAIERAPIMADDLVLSGLAELATDPA